MDFSGSEKSMRALKRLRGPAGCAIWAKTARWNYGPQGHSVRSQFWSGIAD